MTLLNKETTQLTDKRFTCRVSGKSATMRKSSCQKKNFTRDRTWFFIVGSAPWARSNVQSWVRPFWAASCSGVKAQRSVAFTDALLLMSKAAISTCPYDDALCRGIRPPLSCALTSAPCSIKYSATCNECLSVKTSILHYSNTQAHTHGLDVVFIERWWLASCNKNRNKQRSYLITNLREMGLYQCV